MPLCLVPPHEIRNAASSPAKTNQRKGKLPFSSSAGVGPSSFFGAMHTPFLPPPEDGIVGGIIGQGCCCPGVVQGLQAAGGKEVQ